MRKHYLCHTLLTLLMAVHVRSREDTRPLRPLNSWHAPVPSSDRGGIGLLHAGRERRRRELLLASSAEAPALVTKGGAALQQRRAVITTIWSFVATALFAVCVVLPMRGTQGMLDFTTGFLVEKSLSVDNLFVFLMLFEYFKVPEEYTERVLRWGIMSALLLRGVMIAMGVAAVERFRPVLLVFALILVVSAYAARHRPRAPAPAPALLARDRKRSALPPRGPPARRRCCLLARRRAATR